MTEILRLLFQFQTEYKGSPKFISGNILRHAVSLPLNTSIGIFTDSPKLSQPRTYEDFFLIRTKPCFLQPYFELFFDKIHNRRAFRCFFTPQFVTFDVVRPPTNLLELLKSKELIQFGGSRNCGFGEVLLQDYLLIDLDQLEFPSKASHLTLVSPIIYFFPFIERYDCRFEEIPFWNHGSVNRIKIIAPGQFFRLSPGKDPAKLARWGILRKIRASATLFSQFGFGEFVLHNWKGGGA